MFNPQPDEADIPHREWKCEACGADNSHFDAECQFCDGPEAEPESEIEEDPGPRTPVDEADRVWSESELKELRRRQFATDDYGRDI